MLVTLTVWENTAGPLDDFEIPAFRRKGEPGSLRELYFQLNGIEHRIAWLAERGLHPHPRLIASRLGIISRLEARGAPLTDPGDDK